MMLNHKNDKSSNSQQPTEGQGSRELAKMVNRLKSDISYDRKVSIKAKIKQNRKLNETIVSGLIKKVASGKGILPTDDYGNKVDMFDTRMANPLVSFTGLPRSGSSDRNSLIGKDLPESAVKIPQVEMLPPYTSWIYVSKNKKMVEDRSIVGRRSIYYDPEAHQVTDKFRDEDDQILSKVIKEFELNEEVLQQLTKSFGGTSIEIKERCNSLKENELKAQQKDSKTPEKRGSMKGIPLDQSLDEASRAFDYVFCRRCNVFDCTTHGVGQDIVYPVQKQSYIPDTESDDLKKPCSKNCYLQTISQPEVVRHPEELHGEGMRKRKTFDSDGVQTSSCKTRNASAGPQKNGCPSEIEGEGIPSFVGLNQHPNARGSLSGGSEWRPLEKDLVSKGIEMFGRNSCFIARNLLPGTKTCMEVFNYINFRGTPGGSNANIGSSTEHEMENAEERTGNINMDSTLLARKSPFSKEGKFREQKQLSEQASDQQIVNGNSKPKQYTPCRCQGSCGKSCSCRLKRTYCEKYCGCLKTCKNRFKGCQCTKSRCRTRHCNCFACLRECDPDICKNCWISCGDGSQADPSGKAETQCENMKLLMRQRKRILLGRSDVAGWGAFVRKDVEKNEYLGEYTGELITQTEADKRGDLYDLIDRTYLFNLNEKYVIDAYHFGNKLKFANHSSTPNCYPRVMVVNGDHRIGIYAGRNMEAGEEILYDYGYGPEVSHEWAKRPEDKKKEAQFARKTDGGSTSKAPTAMKKGGNL